MINEKILDDLGFVEGAGSDKWDSILQEKFGLKIIDLQNSLCQWINKNAEELSQEFINIAPHGDYSKLLEEYKDIIEFFKTTTSQPEVWEITGVRQNDNPNMIQFLFDCSVVDDGDTLKGFVFVSKSGKIRHTFAQNHT